jgi:transcriptional regulator with XRE-family HTH domain
MDVIRFGLGVRALRRKRGWTQDDLAAKSQVSRTAVWRIERGRADRVAVHVLVRVVAALGARIDVRLLWHGEGLDRLLDAGHADLVERTLRLLASSDWMTATEVSFNVRGERGSIDILAFHPGTGSLLVIEIKSVVPDLKESRRRSAGRGGRSRSRATGRRVLVAAARPAPAARIAPRGQNRSGPQFPCGPFRGDRRGPEA